jgi:uncharacterized protein (DUF697 family)
MTTFLKRYQQHVKRIDEGEFDDASEEERERAVDELIRASCATAAAVAVQPVPLMDTAFLVPLHVTLVQQIGRLRRQPVDRKSAFEILWMFRTNLLTQHSMMAAAKFVPYVGWLVTVSTGHALTYALGNVMNVYFRQNRDLPVGEMRERLRSLYKEDFQRVYRQQRTRLKARVGRAPEVRRKLRELDEQLQLGRIDERERERRREEVLERG